MFLKQHSPSVVSSASNNNLPPGPKKIYIGYLQILLPGAAHATPAGKYSHPPTLPTLWRLIAKPPSPKARRVENISICALNLLVLLKRNNIAVATCPVILDVNTVESHLWLSLDDDDLSKLVTKEV